MNRRSGLLAGAIAEHFLLHGNRVPPSVFCSRGPATVAMWALVPLLDRREAAGNGLLTSRALVIVA